MSALMVPVIYTLFIIFDFKNVRIEENKKIVWAYGAILAAGFVLAMLPVFGVQIAFLSFLVKH